MSPQEFFDSMRIFGEPNIPDNGELATILGGYLRGLGRYPGDVLQRAADTIIATRSVRKFPLPFECLEACQNAQDEIANAARIQREGAAGKPESSDPWSPARIELADKLMDSERGRQAAQEGWIILLHDFCRKEQRLPNNFEVLDLQAAAAALKAKQEKRTREFSGIPRLILPVAKAMEAKFRRLSNLAAGKGPQ